jgi:hypothetical protein
MFVGVLVDPGEVYSTGELWPRNRSDALKRALHSAVRGVAHPGAADTGAAVPACMCPVG